MSESEYVKLLWTGLQAPEAPWLVLTAFVLVRLVGFAGALARDLCGRGGPVAEGFVALVLLLAMPATLTTCLATQVGSAFPAALSAESREALGGLVIAHWVGRSAAERKRQERHLVATSRSALPLVRAGVARVLDQVTRRCEAGGCYPKAYFTTNYLKEARPTAATKQSIANFVLFGDYKQRNHSHVGPAVIGLGVPFGVLLLLGFGCCTPTRAREKEAQVCE